jgi:hypothetical protein
VPGPFYFAWAGGAIEAQVTVITNGTTHGAVSPSVAIVGDTGGSQLTKLATNQGLQEGALYQLAGPSISAGTYFLYDNSILSGLQDSINLSQSAGTQNSTTFTANPAVPVGVALGTLTAGSASVSLTNVGGLTAGVYGVFGTGIGETDVPIATQTGTTYTGGGGILIVGNCYLVYDGAGGGTLAILAATPHTSSALDMFGQTTNVTTYTVAQQPVRATASGQYPLQLRGFPTGDRASITGIPAAALMGLTPGLRYNISGNGIPIGATFIAPSSGSTALEMDVRATSSDVNAVLTITGPRTPDAPFNAAVHNRFDENIISVEIAQEEGGFATLTVDLKNPNVGLLATGRNLWCWLSWDQNWTPAGGGTVNLVPLFNGRLIGVPRLQAGEIVQLQFLGRPDDLNAQKMALSDSLQVLPYYDPVWLAATTTPDTVLETYSALYHTDRTSLGLTISDIIEGEDGRIDIDETQSIYDKFSLAYGQPPLTAVTVSGTVDWQQQGDGVLDVTQQLLDAFSAAGSAYKYAFATGGWGNGGGGLIQVLGDGIRSDWPSPGTTIGGGWSLSTRNDGSGYPLCYVQDATITSQGGWIVPMNVTISFASTSAAVDQTGNTQEQSNVNVFLNAFNQYLVKFPLNVYKIRMNLEYRADRKRTETVTAVLTAGVQRELSDSAESDREAVSMTSEYVGQGVDPDGVLPIGNVAYRSYFQTGRGALSLQYLLLLARAKMRARARAVDITFAVGWRAALAITMRHSVRYFDRRLPGGVAIGKVKSYRLSAGTAGMLGEFTIGCTIGTGVAFAASGGINSYVNDGYALPSWQVISGAQIALNTGDCSYQTLDDFVIADDGLDLTHVTDTTAVNECIVTNGLKVQVPLLAAFNNTVVSSGGPRQTMRTLTTTATIDLKPVQGAEFHTDFFPAVSQLAIPKTIDLSAAAGV